MTKQWLPETFSELLPDHIIHAMHTHTATTPFELEVRKDTRFDFDNSPVIHTRGNRYISHLFNASSHVAPITEGLLIRLARRLAPRITDARIRRDLDGLVGQEGLHSREHKRFNEHLTKMGYGVVEAVARVDAKVRERERTMNDQELLAAMVAGEHAIYAFSKTALLDSRVLETMDPEVKRLLEWHALEEMEHQSVLHDVYIHLYGDHATRRLFTMKEAVRSIDLLGYAFFELTRALIETGEKPTRHELVEFVKWATLVPGAGVILTKEILEFATPLFQPWGHADADRQLIIETLSKVYTDLTAIRA